MIAQVLKEFKEYKIAQPSTIISSENYKVVQIKKNFDEYAAGDWLNKEIIPIQRTLELDKTQNQTNAKPELTKEQVLGKLNTAGPENKKGAQNQKSTNPMETDDLPPNGMMPPAPSLPKKE